MNTTNTTNTTHATSTQITPQLTPHRHCEVIKAYADGHSIQLSDDGVEWVDIKTPLFDPKHGVYRVKPQPKPDVVMYGNIDDNMWSINQESYSTELCGGFNSTKTDYDNLRVVYSGETGELLSVELIK